MSKPYTKTSLYYRWTGMRARCNNPNNDKYHNYGGRGISVCDEWQSFEAFKNWALANGYKEELTLDRKDVNGNYEPDNCRWISIQEQENNRRNTIILTINDITDTLSSWSQHTGINKKVLDERYRKGDRGERLIRKCVSRTCKQ